MTPEHRIAFEIGRLTIEKCTAEANLEQARDIIQDIINRKDDSEELKILIDELANK